MQYSQRAQAFKIHSALYKPLNDWQTLSSSAGRYSVKQIVPALASIGKNDYNVLVANSFNGFLVISDYTRASTPSETSTENLSVVSLDFNPTSDGQDLEIVVGFSTGPILIFDPLKRKRGKVMWLNSSKPVTYSKKLVSLVRWVTLRSDEVVALFEDNTMWRLSKNYTREDEKATSRLLAQLKEAGSSPNDFVVLTSPDTNSNPISVWKFYCEKVTDLRFVPTSSLNPRTQNMFALTTSAGEVKVYDFYRHTAILTLLSYFSGLNALSWSFDGRYIVAGGEDDCVSMWDVESPRLVFRGEGHNSWISAIAFDYAVTTENEHMYRFFSVGQDGRMLVWEITPDSFPMYRKGSVNSPLMSSDESSGPKRDPLSPSDSSRREPGKVLPYPSRFEIPRLESLVDVVVSQEPLVAICVEHNHVFTVDMAGCIQQWSVQPEPRAAQMMPADDSEADTIRASPS